MLRLAGIALVFGAALGTSTVAAQDEAEPPSTTMPASADANEAARAHFDDATAAFEVGDYPRAAEGFRAAYELTQHPDLLYNIYTALEREGGRMVEAADALDRYLELGDVPEERRAPLTARLSRLRARIAEQRAADAERQLAEQRAAAEQRDADRDAERAGGGSSAPPEDEGFSVHPASIGVLVTAGVFLASFAVFAGLSEAEDGELAGTCGRDVPGVRCTDDEVAALNAYNIVADVSWIAAAAVGAAGLVMLFALPADTDEPTAYLAPWVAPGAVGAVAGGEL